MGGLGGTNYRKIYGELRMAASLVAVGGLISVLALLVTGYMKAPGLPFIFAAAAVLFAGYMLNVALRALAHCNEMLGLIYQRMNEKDEEA